MDEEPAIADPSRYRAFVSYSHADAKFAHWLHRRLESWRLPDKTRLAPVFIDRAELAAGDDLSAKVREALAESAALVVVASPNARASRWVGQEIALFRQLHPDRPILTALIAGEPGEAFPETLVRVGERELEPLAADFRKGHDGRRLGLLKIVAGLTGLPLDRLVQRDNQARQRRVMAVTAGALLLSLILAAALVFTLRARAEAERQRAEAEGLVEFMLTDLRDKLRGVGRLEIMGAVNERAMRYYASQSESSTLPEDERLRRARLLLAMGEDDLERQGTRSQGSKEIATAWRITGQLLAEDPDNPEALFWHAQSTYWMGYAAFMTPRADGQRDLDGARVHWQHYARLALTLAMLEPTKPRSAREIGYSHGALCGLDLQHEETRKNAHVACTAARKGIEKAIRLDPGKVTDQLDLASRLAWESDALAESEKWEIALERRQHQVRIVNRALAEQPRDARIMEAAMLAKFGMAKLLTKMERARDAQIELASASALADRLIALDPSNRNWRVYRAQIAGQRPN